MKEQELLQRITVNPAIFGGKPIVIMPKLLDFHARDLEDRAIITVRGDRIRVSRTPQGQASESRAAD